MGLKSGGEGYARKFQPDRRASTMEMMSRVNLDRFPTVLARVFELPVEWLFIGILEISRADTFVTLRYERHVCKRDTRGRISIQNCRPL